MKKIIRKTAYPFKDGVIGFTAALWLPVAVLLCTFSGCASLPYYSPDLECLHARRPLELTGPSGKLGPEQSERMVAQAALTSTPSNNLKRILKIEQALTGTPLIYGNHVEILVDAPRTFKAMFKAIEEAEDHIHLETYRFSDDHVGRKMADILLEKRASGVEVRIIYDGIGNIGGSALFERLERAGVQLLEFHPLDFPGAFNLRRLHLRDHRKLLIVDGKQAFTGGINISILDGTGASGDDPSEKVRVRSRDTQICIEGPAVEEFQKIFFRTWNDLAREKGLQKLTPENGRYFPILDERGEDLVRAVYTDAGGGESRIYRSYMAAIRNAHSRIWLTQAYFVPNREFLRALKGAALRGVDVRLLLQGISDHWIVQASARGNYEYLLEAGVRIYEKFDALLHAKTGVIDGVWSTVGSSNLDYRSFLYNNEANAVIVGAGFGRQMEELFLRDLACSRPVLLGQWRKRSFMSRISEGIGTIMKRWL